MTRTTAPAPTPRTDPDGRVICGVESTADLSFMAGGRYCSLDPEHTNDPNSPHVAYEKHFVTGHGRDVTWLGPWADGRPWHGEQAARLQAEWDNRHDDPVYRAKYYAVLAGVPRWWTITGLDNDQHPRKADGTYMVHCSVCGTYLDDSTTPPPVDTLCDECQSTT